MSHPMLETVNSKISFLDWVALQHSQKNGFVGSYKFRVNEGKKYLKIVRGCSVSSQDSVWCFIDESGNILKPASWSAPTKNFARGTVDDLANENFITNHIYGF